MEIHVALGSVQLDTLAEIFDTTFMISLDTIINPAYECVQDLSAYCFQQKEANFYIELPIKNESYFFYEEFFTRREELINIIPPDIVQGTGRYGFGTFIELTPLGQQVCNSSPTFEKIPPTVLCDQRPFTIDLSYEGDEIHQVVYEFYNPFDHIPLTVVADSNSDPPPYPEIPFLLPQYSFSSPLGMDASINIDPITGILSGTSNGVGIYLVGIKAEEYLNGTLLSTSYRDLNLQFIDCVSNVQAILQNNIQDEYGTYVFNVCNESELLIVNESYEQDYIDNFHWEIGNDFYTDWNPLIDFSSSGQFEGKLVLNPDGICSDTANMIINVNRNIQADFTTNYDTCVSSPVNFWNTSFSEGSLLSQYGWDFGENTFSDEPSPQKKYDLPGSYEVTLEVTDDFGCIASNTKIIDWRPAPAIIIISPNTSEGCVPLTTTFNNLSWPIDSTYSIEWDFGNGSFQSNEINPSIVYEQNGIFDVAISVESPIGCYSDTVFQDLITVEESPVADFSYDPQNINQFSPVINLIDNSERAVQWKWLFDGINSSCIQEPTYTYVDTGMHSIQLIVQDIYGCLDSMLQIVDVVPGENYFLPNAFSPNGDGINDEFTGVGYVNDMLNFELQIIDRWGQILLS